jgi:hypothetical protein
MTVDELLETLSHVPKETVVYLSEWDCQVDRPYYRTVDSCDIVTVAKPNKELKIYGVEYNLDKVEKRINRKLKDDEITQVLLIH